MPCSEARGLFLHGFMPVMRCVEAGRAEIARAREAEAEVEALIL